MKKLLIPIALILGGCAVDRSSMIEPMAKLKAEADYCLGIDKVTPEQYGDFIYAYDYQSALFLDLKQQQTLKNMQVAVDNVNCKLTIVEMVKTVNTTKQTQDHFNNQ